MRTVELTLKKMLVTPLAQVLDHVCKEKLTYKVEKKCSTRDVKEVNIVVIIVLSPES